MDYFISKKDSKGYIYTIDNLVVAYDVYSTSYKTISDLLPGIQNLGIEHNTAYWEKLNLNASAKYSFAKDFIHLDDGIVLFLGTQIESIISKTEKKTKKEYLTFPRIKLEVNPNKHGHKSVLKELLELLKPIVRDSNILRYDLAVDIPKSPDKVQVFNTNKEKGLYKGTRYFGQRNKNGYTRIYDKQKEQKLEYPLTRVETVISQTKTTKELSLEKVYIEDDQKVDPGIKLTKTDQAIIELCELLRVNGLDYKSGLDKLDARKRRFIAEQLGQKNYSLLEYDKELIKDLLEEVMKYFDIAGSISEALPVKELINGIEVDADGFCVLPEVSDLPFD